MKTQEFKAALRLHQEAPLSFVFENGQPVQAGYHITEVKNTNGPIGVPKDAMQSQRSSRRASSVWVLQPA